MTQITIIGNLTSDRELKFISSGAAVTSFTVATAPARSLGPERLDGRRDSLHALFGVG